MGRGVCVINVSLSEEGEEDGIAIAIASSDA